MQTQRDFPNLDGYGTRKAVCKRCHVVIRDCEPMSGGGEFYHPKEDKEGKPHWCRNAGKTFDINSLEMEPFQKKGRRRALRRLGIRP
jgi:hypothetical protein